MQSFLPYPDFVETAQILDRQRLGKQRVETMQILNALTGLSTGWRNHPATKMWEGSEHVLARYGLEMCKEWVRRGFKDSTASFFEDYLDKCGHVTVPYKFFSPELHHSHKLMLIWKLPEWYGRVWPAIERPTQKPEYVWS